MYHSGGSENEQFDNLSEFSESNRCVPSGLSWSWRGNAGRRKHVATGIDPVIKIYFHPTAKARKAPAFLNGASLPDSSLWRAEIAARPAVRRAMAVEFPTLCEVWR